MRWGLLVVAMGVLGVLDPVISQAATNLPPRALNDSGFSTAVDTPLSIPAAKLLANDVDPNGDRLSIASVGSATGGTVSSASGGMIVFTPSPDFRGTASFAYTASDGKGGTGRATVFLSVEDGPFSIWKSSAKPAVITWNDPNPVELGVKFYSDVKGYVLGVRFYKGPQNTGRHTVNLWTEEGKLLDSATSADETASGWQQVKFVEPVMILAGRTYVVSYHTAGYYSSTNDYFVDAAGKGLLHAPASAQAAGNGVYKYGASSAFPIQTWRASNYWVDVLFDTRFPADVQPPTDPTKIKIIASNSQIDLSWQASTDDQGVVHYEIERNAQPLATTDATQYADPGLSPGTSYVYGLTAFDNAGNRSNTVSVSSTTPSSPLPTNCPVALGEGASLGGMLPFPSNNPWNQDISKAAVDPNSAAILAKTDLSTRLHPDFGASKYAGTRIGIPYVIVPETQPMVRTDFTAYASESDPGPYPFPPSAPIEGLGATDYNDRHVLIVQRDCSKPNGLGRLYETFRTFPVGNYPTSVDYWQASGGAVFDLNSNALRPAGWTSADAAGLSIFPGLVRYDEVAAGEIRHALRFTLAPGYTRRAYVYPARHWASPNTGAQYAPFGMRVRLKANVDISYLPPNVQVIARALKKYGMLMADNGGNWFVGGVPDERWDNDELAWLGYLTAGDFEVIKMEAIVTP